MKVKATDVRDLIRRHGTEKGIITAVERMCEELVGIRETQVQTARLIDMIVDQMTEIAKLNGAIANQIDMIRRINDDKTDAGVSVKSTDVN